MFSARKLFKEAKSVTAQGRREEFSSACAVMKWVEPDSSQMPSTSPPESVYSPPGNVREKLPLIIRNNPVIGSPWENSTCSGFNVNIKKNLPYIENYRNIIPFLSEEYKKNTVKKHLAAECKKNCTFLESMLQ